MKKQIVSVIFLFSLSINLFSQDLKAKNYHCGELVKVSVLMNEYGEYEVEASFLPKESLDLEESDENMFDFRGVDAAGNDIRLLFNAENTTVASYSVNSSSEQLLSCQEK